MPPRLYIAGPMTGYPNFNRPSFHAAATRLRAEGYTVVNPAELDESEEEISGKMSWEYYLRRDLRTMLDECDAVAVLPDWELSKGAELEVRVAKALGMRVMPVTAWVVAAQHERETRVYERLHNNMSFAVSY